MLKGSYSWKYHCWKTIVFYTAIIIALNIICLWIYSIFICHITAAISHIQIFIWSSFWRFGLIRSQMFPQRHLFLTVRAFHQTKTNLWVHPFSILGVLKALCAFKRGYRLVTTQSHCQCNGPSFQRFNNDSIDFSFKPKLLFEYIFIWSKIKYD